MSQKVIYKSAKAALTELTELKTVDMWNNQFEAEQDKDVQQQPSAYIELKPQNFRDLSGQAAIQDYDLVITIHLGFEDYDEPELVYDLKQAVHKKLHHLRLLDNTDELEYPISKILRIDERQNFDFDNLIVFEIDYLCKIRDESTSKQITRSTATDTLTLTQTVVTEIV